MPELSELYDAIVNGDQKTAVAVTRQALGEEQDPVDLVRRYMAPAMEEVGRRFQCEQYFIPELLVSARAMKGCMELIRPLLARGGAEPAGRAVIGTVKGDLHDIGKNLVGAMLEGGGFEVVDLGADVSPQKFVEAVREKEGGLVCLSALLTVTMGAMKTTIQALREAGVRHRVKVMVGGAPLSERFAEEIGADGYAPDAPAAVTLARRLLAH